MYVGWFGEVIGRDALPGGSRRLAVCILRPAQRRGHGVHLSKYVIENKVAIGHRTVGGSEIDTVVRCGVDGEVLEGDVSQGLAVHGSDEHGMTAGVIDLDIVEMNIIDGIISGRADIERPLHIPPKIPFVTACAVDTAGVLNGDVVEVEGALLTEPVT